MREINIHKRQTTPNLNSIWTEHDDSRVILYDSLKRVMNQHSTCLRLQMYIPVFLVKLQHHVVRGNAEGPSALILHLAFWLVHVRGRHGAVVGVVIGVDGAAVVTRHIKFNLCDEMHKIVNNFSFTKTEWFKASHWSICTPHLQGRTSRRAEWSAQWCWRSAARPWSWSL